VSMYNFFVFWMNVSVGESKNQEKTIRAHRSKN
jgi:hypothetical protein